jgi:hypothetical protein
VSYSCLSRFVRSPDFLSSLALSAENMLAGDVRMDGINT